MQLISIRLLFLLQTCGIGRNFAVPCLQAFGRSASFATLKIAVYSPYSGSRFVQRNDFDMPHTTDRKKIRFHELPTSNDGSSNFQPPTKGISKFATGELSPTSPPKGNRGRGRPRNPAVQKRDERIAVLRTQNWGATLKQFVAIVRSDEVIRDLCQHGDLPITGSVVRNALYRRSNSSSSRSAASVGHRFGDAS